MEQNMSDGHYYRVTLYKCPDDALPINFTFRAADTISARNHAFEMFPGCEIVKIELAVNNEHVA